MSGLSTKYVELLEGLYNRTIAQKINWSVVTGVGHATCKVGDLQIRMRAGKSSDGEPLEVVEIIGINDQIIDSFNDNVFDRATPKFSNSPTYYLLMQDLRRMALRKARGADEAIDNILTSLKDI